MTARAWAALALSVDVLTQPLLYAVSARFTSSAQLVAAEVAVVAVETTLLSWWWRVRAREGVTTLALAVVAANALSTAAGLLVP